MDSTPSAAQEAAAKNANHDPRAASREASALGAQEMLSGAVSEAVLGCITTLLHSDTG
jgi:hypothetical protein